VPYQIDTRLVRGLDYYTRTTFEYAAEALESAQNAIGGGGRYDNLVETLGGKPTPGVGFGSGLERLLIALEAQGVAIPNAQKPLVWLVSQNDAAREENFKLLAELRAADIAADMDVTGRSMKSQFKLADREKAAWCIIVGENEIAASTVTWKNLKTGEQSTLSRSDVVMRLKSSV
jgi:histidyl-tRNA synthetase